MTTQDHNKTSNKMWGGRFFDAPDALMTQINASIGFDQCLFAQDIDASLAHANMLAAQKIITQDDAKNIHEGLTQIRKKIETGQFSFSETLEDIHMNIEAELANLIGEPAKRLHTARSRNDQVATDFKLWVRDKIDAIIDLLDRLILVFLDQAEKGVDLIMPGFTHLQTAQPITWGHHMMAYVEMLSRDKGRFSDARVRMNECPLGACALAGTSFPIDRDATSKALGFDRPMANSLDAVSDRDFALEFMAASSICATHLSRLAEEIVIWSTTPFGFVRLSDLYTTGSSIMPQKRNPDAAELVRAKTGRINGALLTLLTVMKGLPLAYSKDMQEDKEPVFETAKTLDICLTVMIGMLGDLVPQPKAMRAAASAGFSTATDLADFLVQNLNLPFRTAHHVTGSLVGMAEKQGIDLGDLSLADMQSIEPGITAAVYERLGVDNSVNSRISFGGTAPEQVRLQIKLWRKRLKK